MFLLTDLKDGDDGDAGVAKLGLILVQYRMQTTSVVPNDFLPYPFMCVTRS